MNIQLKTLTKTYKNAYKDVYMTNGNVRADIFLPV